MTETSQRIDHAAVRGYWPTLQGQETGASLADAFRNGSEFSAEDLAQVLRQVADPAALVGEILREARVHFEAGEGLDAFTFSRILHSLGTAVERYAGNPGLPLSQILPGLGRALPDQEHSWLASEGLLPDAGVRVGHWSERARVCAFRGLRRAISSSSESEKVRPRSALRSDEIVWGRVPARLDLGGGWTDTPPYSLECGGCVINAAVELNGQPPIQCYARVVDRPVIRIVSIDLGLALEIATLDELLDYRDAGSGFALAKGAIALSGISPEWAAWPEGMSLHEILRAFGGGIEVTTLAAIPKGSGLGTSSIMGAVILAVLHRVMGRRVTQRQLFHDVLRLEQELTTGGGWQDQIGGSVGGVKRISTEAGLIPDPSVHYVLGDVLDPKVNGGQTLLYYTGVTRLAKNILQQVVGRYLDRDPGAMATLRRLHEVPQEVADALAEKDIQRFGELIDVAWELNKQLDPDSSNDEIEATLGRIRPHVFGAKLLGAGGGGFLFMVCKSGEAARAVRKELQEDPPNERARFFQYGMSEEGLVVTVC